MRTAFLLIVLLVLAGSILAQPETVQLMDVYRGEVVLFEGRPGAALSFNFTERYVTGWSVYNHQLVGVSRSHDLNILDLDTLELTHILHVDGRGIQGALWSPDGNQIAFENYDWDDDGIYVVNADGSNLRQITGADFIWAEYEWYDNSSLLLSLSTSQDVGTPVNDLYLVDTINGTSIRLTDSPSVLEMGLAVSVEGKIAYYTRESTDAGNGRMEAFTIFVMDDLASGPRPVVNEGRLPSWSPDGQSLAYIQMEIDLEEYVWRYLGLGTVASDGSDQQTLYAGEDICFDAYWSPDNHIYYYRCFGDYRYGTNTMGFYLIDPNGETSTEIYRSTVGQQFFVVIDG